MAEPKKAKPRPDYKKWTLLRQDEKNFILKAAEDRHSIYVVEFGRLPPMSVQKEIEADVCRLAAEHGIMVEASAVRSHVHKKLARQNKRKAPVLEKPDGVMDPGPLKTIEDEPGKPRKPDKVENLGGMETFHKPKVDPALLKMLLGKDE
jgi:hypothetical protein